MDNINSNNLIAKNTILLGVRTFLTILITLYTTRVLLSALGVNDYGLYNVVCGFVSMFAFMNVTLSASIQRFYNFELGKNGLNGVTKIFNTACLIQFFLIIVVLLFSETVGIWYLKNKMVIMPERTDAAYVIFQLSVLSFVFLIFQAPFSGAVMAHEKMDVYALISIVDSILKLGIAYLISITENIDRLQLYALLITILSFINLIIYLIYAKKNFKELKFRLNEGFEHLTEMLSFSLWNVISSFATMLREQGLNLVLNFFLGTSINAARGISLQIVSGLNGLTQNLTTASRPQIVKSYSTGNPKRSISLMFGISKLSFLFYMIVSIPVILEIKYILQLWLGNDIPPYTESFVIIVILSAIIQNFNSPISAVIHATGNVKRYQLITSAISLITIPLAYIFLRCNYSPNSALIVSLIITGVNQIISLFLLKTVIPFSIRSYIKEIVIPLMLVTILTFPIPYFVCLNMTPSFLRLVLVSLFTIIIGSTVAYFVALGKNEKQLVISYMNKIFKRKKNDTRKN